MLYIIDDYSSVMRGYKLLLQSAGYESNAFSSADKFLNGCTPGESDLLILDMVMPGMNGCDLLEYFTEKKSG